MEENINIKSVKELLKSSVIFNDFEEVLKLGPDTIIGIDNVNAEKLKKTKHFNDRRVSQSINRKSCRNRGYFASNFDKMD